MVIKGEKASGRRIEIPRHLSHGIITSVVDVSKSLNPGLTFPLGNKRTALVYNLPRSLTVG